MSQTELASVLKRRMSYVYVLLVFLFFLTFLSQSQAVFADKDWSSAGANTLHVILLTIATVCVVGVDIKTRRAQPKLEESAGSFAKTLVIGAGWFFIFMALMNPPKDLLEQVFMGVYFWKGACIEEVTFRYGLPRLLNVEGYGYWVSQLISNALFSWCHFFVWAFNLATAIIGFAFGLATMIAFAYGRSFMGIVWGHTLYNLCLAGANANFLIMITAIAVIAMVLWSVKHSHG